MLVNVSDEQRCVVKQRRGLTKSVGHLLQHAEEVHVLAAALGGRLLVVVVLLVHVLLVAGGREEGHVNVEIVRHLDAAYELSL